MNQRALKRTVAFLLMILLLLCTIPLNAFAAVKTINSVKYGYVKKNGGSYINSITTKAATVIIPNKINGLTVKGLMDIDWRGSNAMILYLPDTLKYISPNAFYNSALEHINLKNSTVDITPSTFLSETNIEEIYVPKTNKKYTSVDWVLYNKAKTAIITIPSNRHKDLVIPATVKDIKGFVNINNIKISVDPKNKYLVEENGVIYNKDKTKLLLCNTSKAGEFVIPKTVKTISVGAFAYCNKLTKVTIPDSVTKIPDFAFYNCTSLSKVTIPSTVKTIGKNAFESSALTSIKISNNVTSIGEAAFKSTKAKTLKIGTGLKKIPREAFANTSIVTVNIPKNVTSIGEKAFVNCSAMTTLNIGKNVKSIGLSAFESCTSLKKIVIPDSVKTLADYAFNCCGKVTSLSIGKGIKEIGDWTFGALSSLKNLTIPNNVTKIGHRAFISCEKLQSLSIGSGLKTIDEEAFWYANKLKNIKVNKNNKTFSSDGNAIFNKNKTKLILFLNGPKTSYTIPKTVKAIGKKAFMYSDLKSVNIPDTVTSIGESAFSDNYKLKSIRISNKIKVIESYAFANCWGLESVVLPKSITRIEAYAFTSGIYTAEIKYRGTKKEWKKIKIYSGNDLFNYAKMKYNVKN